MQSLDQLKLQKLIDGELDRESVQVMLKTAEANPQHWREMAVGFVEDRLWESEFTAMSKTDDSDSTRSIVKAAIPSHRAGGKPPLRWFAIAAGILLGLSIGYLASLGGSSNVDDVTNQPGPAIADTNPGLGNTNPDLDQAPERQVSYRPDYHMRLNSPDGAPMLASEVPLFKQSNAEKMGLDMSRPVEISGELATMLEQSGYQLDQKINYISGKLDDGRQFIVPIRTTRIHHGQ